MKHGKRIGLYRTGKALTYKTGKALVNRISKHGKGIGLYRIGKALAYKTGKALAYTEQESSGSHLSLYVHTICMDVFEFNFYELINS